MGETSAKIHNIAINARNATPNDLKVFVFTKDLLYVFIFVSYYHTSFNSLVITVTPLDSNMEIISFKSFGSTRSMP